MSERSCEASLSRIAKVLIYHVHAGQFPRAFADWQDGRRLHLLYTSGQKSDNLAVSAESGYASWAKLPIAAHNDHSMARSGA
jgi:hypothetical protein